MSCIGLQDKLYWRQPTTGGVWHCFKAAEDVPGLPREWISLCGKRTIARTGGQSCSRPNPWLRCATCDVREMERRGWDESGPESPKGSP